MTTTTIREGAVLTQRQLNRVLLARQHLLRRSEMAVPDMIRTLVGMQSQEPNDPFIGLWTRICGFHPDTLSAMMLDRTAVRASLMRGTIHLVTADDYLAIFPVTLLQHQRTFPQLSQGRLLDPAITSDVVAAGQKMLRAEPMSIKALGIALAERWPDVPPGTLAQAIRFLLPLVQVTPRGTWGASHGATWALAEEWLGTAIPEHGDPAAIIRRYLVAFGPATITDIQAWSGMQGLRAVVDGMREELVTFRNERGQELLDVPGAPMPDGDEPAPVRFLPGFENALLAHRDRTRIISEERRRWIGSRNGRFAPTYLVGGFVAGTWMVEISKETATLTIRPFEPHAPDILDALEDEAFGLLRLLSDGRSRDIHFSEIAYLP